MIFLGVDCGTQSTKTVALDGGTGKVIASATQPYDLIPGLPAGHTEQHPSTWIDAMEKTIGGVLDELGARRAGVRGIGVSGQQHGFVPLDKDGHVIRPVKLWNDTSTAAECELFREHFGGAGYFIERTGLDMLPGYTAPKILWLKRHEPDNFAKLATVLLPHDYLNFHLTGNFRMEYGDASGTGLLNIRSGAWERDILEFIDASLPEKMPLVGSSLEPAGMLRPELAARWNLPGGGDRERRRRRQYDGRHRHGECGPRPRDREPRDLRGPSTHTAKNRSSTRRARLPVFATAPTRGCRSCAP